MGNRIDLAGRVAVVTGGAQGIGRAIVEHFLESGAAVAIWDRDLALAQRVIGELESRGRIAAVAVDVVTASGRTAAIGTSERRAPIDPAWPGLARELARMNLSLNFYTQWYWKTDLHNLMHFLSLRADPHAQYEIRAYAEAMLQTMQRWVPLAHAAFLEYRMNAALISATGLAVIQRMLAGEAVDQPASGLSAREWRELMAVLKNPAAG